MAYKGIFAGMGKLFDISYFFNVIPKLIVALPDTLLVVISALTFGLAIGFYCRGVENAWE